jgi:hypothetical protein
MYSLSVIHKINNRSPRIIDHTNVGCGWNETKSGIIIHSASLRSTLVLVSPEAISAFKSWKGSRQRDAWIEAFFRDQTPEGGNLGVLRHRHPRWTFKAVTGKRGAIYEAISRESLPTRHASLSARLLSTLIR